MKTCAEFIKEYRKEIDPITGRPSLFRNLTDETVWDAAQKEIKIVMQRQIDARDEYVRWLEGNFDKDLVHVPANSRAQYFKQAIAKADQEANDKD